MQNMGKIMLNFLIIGSLVSTIACVPSPVSSPGGTLPQPSTIPGKTTPQPVPTPGPASAIGSGIIEIRVTDPPPADVAKAIVFLTNIEVHKVSNQISENVSDNVSGTGSDNVSENESDSDNVSDGGGEWIKILGAPPSFDLMTVSEVMAILGSANVTAGSFTQIRMDVTKVEVTTTSGDNFTAEVPSGKLRIVRPFNVKPGLKTVLTLDFDGSKSLIVTGKGKALFKPVLKLLIETGKPPEAGKPAETGRPTGTGKPEEPGKPAK